MGYTLLEGDSKEVLKTLPDQSVHMCVTSPPYYKQRSYPTATWENGDSNCDHEPVEPVEPDGSCRCGATRQDKQSGLETTIESYVTNLVNVFREVKRVLRDDGTLWLNLGDSYSGGGYSPNSPSNVRGGSKQSKNKGSIKTLKTLKELPAKCLMMIPARVCLALMDDGWILRSEIIIAKKSCMPESCRDRPTKSHEVLYLFSKKSSYYFDAEAVRQVAEGRSTGRNIRTVWNITSTPFRGSHYATFSKNLVRPCILAGSSEVGCCPHTLDPYHREVESKSNSKYRERYQAQLANGRNRNRNDCGSPMEHVDPPEHKTIGWSVPKNNTNQSTYVPPQSQGWISQCEHNSQPAFGRSGRIARGILPEPIPCTVLDPFCGASTTGVVCKELGRNYIGIDLCQEYLEMSRQRIEKSI